MTGDQSFKIDEFTRLRALLLAELEDLLLSLNDPYIDSVDRIEDRVARDRYLTQHHLKVVERLRRVKEPYSEVLTALFDLEAGIDRVRWVGGVLNKNDGVVRDRMVATEAGTVFLQALYERHDVLLKKCRRANLIPKAIEDVRLKASEESAAADPAVGARNASAHHAFVQENSGLAWVRESDKHEFWKISSLWWDSDESMLTFVHDRPDPHIADIQMFWSRRVDRIEAFVDETLRSIHDNLLRRVPRSV